MKPAAGMRQEGSVVVNDEREAQRLHAKGHVGEPVAGGGLRLSLVEAAYAAHEGRLDVDGASWVDLLAGQEAAYFAYADLRDRGLVVRPAGDAMQVWRRGEAPPSAPWFPLHTATERDALRPLAALAWAKAEAVVALVDEDGTVTHYRFTPALPSGDVALPSTSAGAGGLLADRVVVAGGAAWADARLGTAHGEDLLLSLTEAEMLRRRGLLDIEPLTPHAAGHHHFGRTLPVYEALRDAGVVAKSGFRFGTHLRGYDRDPGGTHARWLIQCAHPDDALHWSELSRAVRLAHGVRKQFLLAVTGPVRFAAIEWFRP